MATKLHCKFAFEDESLSKAMEAINIISTYAIKSKMMFSNDLQDGIRKCFYM